MLRAVPRSLLLALLALGLLAAPAAAVPTVSGEFPVSGLDSNNKLVQGPDGNMWVTLASATADVARVEPNGKVTEYDLGLESPSGIAAAAGKIWVTRSNGVTSFSPADPLETDAGTTIAAIAGNHSIVLAPDGNLWAAGQEALVRIPPGNPAGFKAFPVAGISSRDIDVAGSLLVVANFGTESVITATLADPPVTKEVKVGGGPQGVAGGPGGQIAYTQPSNEPKQIGIFTPPGAPATTNFPGADPFGITFGPDGAYWSAESNFDKLIRVTTDNQVTELTGFAAGSKPRQIAPGPGNTLWVTLETAKKVALVSGVETTLLPPPPPPTKPSAKIDKGPRGQVRTKAKKAKVTFRFSSTDATATFQCRLVKVKKKGKKAKTSKAPAFKACRSPKTYKKLNPGKYRFEVRAVNAAGTGKSVKRSFRVVRVAG